ncbi:hypothetical protein KJ742_04085, partial [Patescibacteria group bacterium]|nr:hypothetical protein [Patescibacteria group bacterium]
MVLPFIETEASSSQWSGRHIPGFFGKLKVTAMMILSRKYAITFHHPIPFHRRFEIIFGKISGEKPCI